VRTWEGWEEHVGNELEHHTEELGEHTAMVKARRDFGIQSSSGAAQCA